MQLHKDRIAIIIGQNGSTKKLIEEKTGTILNIDSDDLTLSIMVNGEAVSQDPTDDLLPEGLRKYITKMIIDAINHGFNPKKALKLLNEEMAFEIIDLEKVLGNSSKKLRRIKGRLIGKAGKVRNSIEYFSGANLSIYNKYIAIIGVQDQIKICKKAINMIIQGAPHKPVLDYLQEQYELRKRDEFTKMWKPTL